MACDVYDGVLLCCLFFPRGVLDEILNLIESVSEGFPFYSSIVLHRYICGNSTESSDVYLAREGYISQMIEYKKIFTFCA